MYCALMPTNLCVVISYRSWDYWDTTRPICRTRNPEAQRELNVTLFWYIHHYTMQAVVK